MNHAPPPRVTAEPARVAVPSRMFVHAYDLACVRVRVCVCFVVSTRMGCQSAVAPKMYNLRVGTLVSERGESKRGGLVLFPRDAHLSLCVSCPRRVSIGSAYPSLPLPAST